MKQRCKELPEELWESILNRLADEDDDYCDLQSPSLVCKQFLSITNRFRQKLAAKGNVFYNNRCETLCRALERFGSLKEIELSHLGAESDVDCQLLRIASSGLDLQSLSLYGFPNSPSANTFRILGSNMNNLKVLRCTEFVSLRDPDLVHIADALPRLEELDIRHLITKSNHSVTDAGIEAISRKLLGLRKINISGNRGCSDRSLIALSSNCVLLIEIRCSTCNITAAGIDFALRHSPNLISLRARDYQSSFTFEDSKTYARNLRAIDLCPYGNQDRLVCSIAKAGIPLEKLILRDGYKSNLSAHAVLILLRACPTLKHFKLDCFNFLNDDSIRYLCRYLPNLVSIKLVGPSKLTPATFFVLAKECPLLSKITLEIGTLEKVQDEIVANLEKNYRIRFLDLSHNWLMKDELLKQMVFACPNLRTLDVGGCGELTKECLEEILKSCPEIKHLKVVQKTLVSSGVSNIEYPRRRQ